MNQIIVKSFGSVEGARKYAGALRSSTRHISTGSTRDILKIDEHGEWHFGQDKTVVERDDVWAINPLTICHGYIAFENKKVAFDMDGEEAFISMSVTQELPEYDRLPELDTRPRKGEDPAKWAFQMSLEMVCVEGPNKGAEVLYSPTSAGGLRIIRIVAEEIARKFDDTDPGKIVPVVELDTARSYVNKKGKTIVPPAMHIIDWLGLDDDTFAAREEVKEDRDEPARGKRDVERTAKGDKVEQRRRREAPADEAPRRGAARTVESDEAEDSDVAEEPRRGRGRPRNDRDATPSEVERANIRGEVAHREARQAREAPVEDAPVASRGRRGARDRDEATADEADAPARGHSRRDDEDDRPARDSGRGRNIARSDIEHGVAPRGRRAAAGGRH